MLNILTETLIAATPVQQSAHTLASVSYPRYLQPQSRL